MFHYVVDDTGSSSSGFEPRFAFSRSRLTSLIHTLSRQGKKFVTFLEYSEVVQFEPKASSQLVCLTFDDATKDHYTVVAPTLSDLQVNASFYCATQVLQPDRPEPLPIHLFHVASSLVPDEELLAESIVGHFELTLGREKLRAWREYFEGWAGLDSANILFAKRLLEVALPASELREIVARSLQGLAGGQSLVKKYEEILPSLYCSAENLKEMRGAGLEIGSHSHSHRWLGKISTNEALSDVERSVTVLRGLSLVNEEWTLCLPHGSWTVGLLQGLKKLRGCVGGLGIDGSEPPDSMRLMAQARVDVEKIKKEE